MKISPTVLLAFTNYTMVVVSLVAPWMFGFSADAVATSSVMAFGVTLAAYSLVTEFELSFRRLIPLKLHLALNVVMSAVLVASPFVLEFASAIWAPHLAVGGIVLGMTLFVAFYLRFAHPARHVRAVVHPQVTAESVNLQSPSRRAGR
jgi:hypothetical protein